MKKAQQLEMHRRDISEIAFAILVDTCPVADGEDENVSNSAARVKAVLFILQAAQLIEQARRALGEIE